MGGEELLVASEATRCFHEVEPSADGVAYLDEECVSNALFRSRENSSRVGLCTTARMIVKSSHQKAWTMKMRVNRRRSRKIITRTRKNVVMPLIGDSQLPSAEAMA